MWHITCNVIFLKRNSIFHIYFVRTKCFMLSRCVLGSRSMNGNFRNANKDHYYITNINTIFLHSHAMIFQWVCICNEYDLRSPFEDNFCFVVFLALNVRLEGMAN